MFRALLLTTAAGLSLLQPAQADSLYRCGNAYQATPCDAAKQGAGSEVRLFVNRPTDRELFDAEVRKMAGKSFVAKFPNIYYSFGDGSWYGMRIVNGEQKFIPPDLTDPDVMRVQSQDSRNRLQERFEQIDRDHEQRMANMRYENNRIEKHFDVERAKIDERYTCRTGSQGACADARSVVRSAEKQLKDAGGTPERLKSR